MFSNTNYANFYQFGQCMCQMDDIISMVIKPMMSAKMENELNTLFQMRVCTPHKLDFEINGKEIHIPTSTTVGELFQAYDMIADHLETYSWSAKRKENEPEKYAIYEVNRYYYATLQEDIGAFMIELDAIKVILDKLNKR